MAARALEQPDLAGQTLGHYRLVERIGAGGMGVVYRAHDQHLECDVAIKVLPAGSLGDEDARKRFRREALALSQLNHPNIEVAHDFDTQDGLDFLVTEYIPGQTLEVALASRLPEKGMVDLGAQLAEGLAAAHEQGVVHRDLKPSNLLVTGDGRLKILDFGLAKMIRKPNPTAVTESLSRTQGTVGTLPYMAPEQVQGQKADARSDLWAVGAVLYEMATRQRPFPGSGVQLADAIRFQEPRPPRQANPELSVALEAIILRCLEKDPDLRYQSARELATHLRRLQRGEAPLPAPLPAPRPRRRRRWAPALAGAVALLALGLLAAALSRWWYAPSSVPRDTVLIADFDNAGSQPVPDQALREGLTIALQQSREVKVYPRARVYEVLQRMERPEVERIDARLGREICQRENIPVLLTGSITHLGNVFQITIEGTDAQRGELLFAEKTEFQGQDKFFAEVDRLARRVRRALGESRAGVGSSSRSLAQVTTASVEALQLYSQAADAVARGQRDQAPALLHGALALDPDFAMAHRLLAECYAWGTGKNEKAMAEIQRAYELRQNTTERERLWIEADYYSAVEQYDEEVQSLKALQGLYPRDPEVHERLARAYYDIAQLPAAIEQLRLAVQGNPSASSYGRLVMYLAENNQNQEAEQAFAEARKLGLESFQMHWGLGLAYLGEGRTDLARSEFHKLEQGPGANRELGEWFAIMTDLYEGRLAAATQKLSSRLPPKGSAQGGFVDQRRSHLGRILLLRGDARGAERQAELILTVPETEMQTISYLRAGVLFVESGNAEAAQGVLRRLDTIRKQTPSSWNESCFYNLEGEMARAQGNHAQALTSFQAALARYPESQPYRGLARTYQAQADWTNAARQWERFLLRQGEILLTGFPTDLALAHLELARLYRRLGDRAGAQGHYRKFLAMWRQADNQALFRQAADELRALTQPEPPQPK